ncbi:DUF2637 domain-containing protein [Methanospirillum sp.]
METLVPAATGVLTLVVALCSFVLSFSNLRSSAVEAGFDPILTWCWPICIDALLISGSLMVFRGNSPGGILGFRVGGPHHLHRDRYLGLPSPTLRVGFCIRLPMQSLRFHCVFP